MCGLGCWRLDGVVCFGHGRDPERVTRTSVARMKRVLVRRIASRGLYRVVEGPGGLLLTAGPGEKKLIK